jgi:hypothetical protein
VADEPLAEIQIDIAVFTASGALNDGFRYVFVAVDIFLVNIVILYQSRKNNQPNQLEQ